MGYDDSARDAYRDASREAAIDDRKDEAHGGVAAPLVAVVKAAPIKKRTALFNAILASHEIEDSMCRPWDDGRKLLGFIGAACGKGR